MVKKTIISSIQTYLEKQEDIQFAYLFGSFVSQDRYRDIDLAVYSEKPDLMKLGSMQTDLAKRTNTEIDLIYLNGFPGTNPGFGYQVVTRGELIYNKASHKHDEFKKRVLLAYFDTAPLRNQMNRAFINRIRSNKFGERDYA